MGKDQTVTSIREDEKEKFRLDGSSKREEEETSESNNSSDEALFEMLGLPSSLGDPAVAIAMEEDTRDTPRTLEYLLNLPESDLRHMLQEETNVYAQDSVCCIAPRLCVEASFMRRITDELSWGKHASDKSYERIKVFSRGEIIERRQVTRFENFVRSSHTEWKRLCDDYIGRLVSIICQQPMTLFKEKLNLKPPGGSGFAPHLDTPSLRVALGAEGPQNFVTVMIAIDNMTVDNGCLQFVKGKWSDGNAVETIQPDLDGNPDGNGRAGAIPTDVAETLPFEPFECQGGTIVLFNGWVPHRSAANKSAFPRRAVFLTYNPLAEGACRDEYYAHMDRLRSEFRLKAGLERQKDEQAELEALATIPKI